jgi:DNA replication licensing factor MCM4
MDLITTGVSASERMRRENLASAARSIITEKMQLEGPSMRLLEVCKYAVCRFFKLLFNFNHS